MRDGGHLGLLIDQKMNEGIPVPFFGRDAWTATAPADLALKFKAPVVPARIVRLPGARFKIEVFPPMELPDTGDRKADVRTLITQMTALIEGWIRDNPEQWFWVHRRWPNE
jgi:KDO2-lipid IV(A) lauroyltransferase